MTKDRYITITAAFDPRYDSERSLGRIAPELADALTLIDNDAAEHCPTRTWAGIVDGPTFQRFAAAWRLPDEIRAPGPARRTCTLDGMNWETDDESPVTYVTVHVAPAPTARTTRSRMAAVRIRHRPHALSWRRSPITRTPDDRARP